MKKILFLMLCCLPALAQTKSDLQGTARVFDLEFTSQELDTLYSDVLDNLANYKAMHKLSLNNNVPLSLWQNPALPGMKFDLKQRPIIWPKSIAKLPVNKSDLAFYSIDQLAYLIKSRQITSLDLTRFFIDRIKKHGDALQCVVSLQEEIAFKQARQADREIAAGKYRGLLHGIPYGLKDLFAIKGTKTTWGAAPYKDQMRMYTNDFVMQELY
jgi:hypothetical protein